MDINTAIRLLDTFRGTENDIPIQYASALLYVATHEGCGLMEVGPGIDLTPAGGARAVKALWEERPGGGIVATGSRKKKPLGLVDIRPHPTSGRSKQVFLSARGRELLAKILAI